MKEPTLKTPREWEKDKGFDQIVIDPDGWRFNQTIFGIKVNPRPFGDPLPFIEYELRRAVSTIGPKR